MCLQKWSLWWYHIVVVVVVSSVAVWLYLYRMLLPMLPTPAHSCPLLPTPHSICPLVWSTVDHMHVWIKGKGESLAEDKAISLVHICIGLWYIVYIAQLVPLNYSCVMHNICEYGGTTRLVPLATQVTKLSWRSGTSIAVLTSSSTVTLIFTSTLLIMKRHGIPIAVTNLNATGQPFFHIRQCLSSSCIHNC